MRKPFRNHKTCLEMGFLRETPPSASNDTLSKEELLIDFHELVGKHSGENMAEAVWETLK